MFMHGLATCNKTSANQQSQLVDFEHELGIRLAMYNKLSAERKCLEMKLMILPLFIVQQSQDHVQHCNELYITSDTILNYI
jgi:hypothetical protein